VNFTLAKGEPLYGAIARAEIYAGEHVYTIMSRYLRGTPAETLAFALPCCLEAIVKNLPPNLGVTPDELIDHHTMFPALAPFLAPEEASKLRARMRCGARGSGFWPICERRDFGRSVEHLRYCPMCAFEDRTQGLMIARWRMSHHCYGVDACHTHGCRLIVTNHPVVTTHSCCSAEIAIPEKLPTPEKARELDVTLANDLAVLFAPGCPQPGRHRIAAALRQALDARGYLRGLSRGCATNQLFADMGARFGQDWLSDRGIHLVRGDCWPRLWTQMRPNVVPAFFIAVLGRFLSCPLTELMQRAQVVSTASPRTRGARQRVRSRTHLASEVELHRAILSAALVDHPTASRTVLRSQFRRSISVLSDADSEWLFSKLPVRRSTVRRPRSDWPERDAALATKVRMIATEMRHEIGLPRRITKKLLIAAARRGEQFSIASPQRLPLHLTALADHADTNLSFAKRRIDWLAAEISAGREPDVRSETAFLRRIGLSSLSAVHGEIAEAVKAGIAGLWPDKAS
jgi:hypothetical protein